MVAGFIAEGATQNQNLFAKRMLMGFKSSARLVANDRGGLGDLTALALQHLSLNPPFGAGNPGKVIKMNDDPFTVIGMDVHGGSLGG